MTRNPWCMECGGKGWIVGVSGSDAYTMDCPTCSRGLPPEGLKFADSPEWVDVRHPVLKAVGAHEGWIHSERCRDWPDQLTGFPPTEERVPWLCCEGEPIMWVDAPWLLRGGER
jgi:hypothetical protein